MASKLTRYDSTPGGIMYHPRGEYVEHSDHVDAIEAIARERDWWRLVAWGLASGKLDLIPFKCLACVVNQSMACLYNELRLPLETPELRAALEAAKEGR